MQSIELLLYQTWLRLTRIGFPIWFRLTGVGTPRLKAGESVIFEGDLAYGPVLRFRSDGRGYLTRERLIWLRSWLAPPIPFHPRRVEIPRTAVERFDDDIIPSRFPGVVDKYTCRFRMKDGRQFDFFSYGGVAWHEAMENWP